VDEKLANQLITALETNLQKIHSQLRSGKDSVGGSARGAAI
jgi:hypothetical protein